MAITLKPTDNVKYGSAGTKSTTWRVSGKTGTIGQSGTTGTYYITENFSKTFPGPVEEVTPADNVNSYSIKGKTVTCSLKGSQSNTTVSAILTVKYSTSQDVFVINKKDGTAAWKKCKPVTCIFDETMIDEIQFSGEGDDFAYHSGDTVYIPCGDEYYIDANPKTGYTVTTQGKTINLLNISSLTLSDFDPVTYTFEAVASMPAGYTVIVPAKTAYITSANLNYTRGGVEKTASLTSGQQTITVDVNTNVYYSNITPVSGYTANYTSSAKFTPNKDNYIIPALKVNILPLTITLSLSKAANGDTLATYSFANPNPTPINYSAILSNSMIDDLDVPRGDLSGTLSANSSTGYRSKGFGANLTVYGKATASIEYSDGTLVTGADSNNFSTNWILSSTSATLDTSST